MKEPEKIRLGEILRFLNDPFLPVRSKAGIARLQQLASTLQFELQDMGDAAVDCLVMLAQQADVDWPAYQERLLQHARIADLIADLHLQEDLEEARSMVKMSLRMDAIANDLQALRETKEQSNAHEVQRDRLYSREEAAERLGVSVSTIDREIRRGHLRTVQVGRRVMISGNDLLVYRDTDDDIRILGD